MADFFWLLAKKSVHQNMSEKMTGANGETNKVADGGFLVDHMVSEHDPQDLSQRRRLKTLSSMRQPELFLGPVDPQAGSG